MRRLERETPPVVRWRGDLDGLNMRGGNARGFYTPVRPAGKGPARRRVVVRDAQPT